MSTNHDTIGIEARVMKVAEKMFPLPERCSVQKQIAMNAQKARYRKLMLQLEGKPAEVQEGMVREWELKS